MPAGPTGAFGADIAPKMTFSVNGRMDLRGSVTLNCNIGYKWTNTTPVERISECGTSYEPLAVTAATGVDLTAVGTLTTSIAWNNLVGINGSIAGTVHAGYHPTTSPVGVLDAKASATLGGCVLCFWNREELRVTIVNRTIFEQVIARWDTVPPVVNDDPRITTDTLPAAPLGAPYSQRLRTADNRTGRWDVAAGSLPHGLELVGDTIQGKPTNLQGLVTFRIRFTDAQRRVVAKDLSIRVIAGTTPPSGAIEDLSDRRRSIIAANDDGASERIPLPFPIKLISTSYSSG